MKMKKRLLTATLGITILASSLSGITAPSFATSIPSDITGHWSEPFVTSLVSQGVISGYPDGTFKPDKDVTYAEFLVLTLKALNVQPDIATNGQAWYVPIIDKSIEIGIIKSTDNMAKLEYANLPIPRQESAYVLYNALGIKEGLEYNHTYDKVLDQAVFDHENIGNKYHDAVYAMLQQGMFTGSNNNFEPASRTTRGASSVIIDRVIDPSKRASRYELTQNVVIGSQPYWAKVSETSIEAEFSNGEPVINKAQVISELSQYEDNTNSFGLYDTLHYQDYINSEWKAYGYNTIEKKTEAVNIAYQVVVDYAKARYNFTYLSDLDLFQQNLQKYMSDSSQGMIYSLADKIKSDTLIMKSHFITDKSLLYSDNQGRIKVRGRLYFIFENPSKSSYFDVSSLDIWCLESSVNQWYYVDMEIESVVEANEKGLKPCVSSEHLMNYLSDFVAVK